MREPSRSIRVAFVVLALNVFLGACQPKPYPALRVPLDEFKRRIDTVCYDSLRMDFDLPDRKVRVADLEAMLRNVLEEEGYKVVPPQETIRVYRETVTRQGGYFDPNSGHRNDERYELVRKRALEELGKELGCDAILIPTVAVVYAGFDPKGAQWDGMTEYLGLSADGWVRALSIWVSIRDLSDEELYFGTGGIETLAVPSGELFGDDFEPVNIGDLLTNRSRNLGAVRISLRPLLQWRE
jgi:hypothetical protein